MLYLLTANWVDTRWQ